MRTFKRTPRIWFKRYTSEDSIPGSPDLFPMGSEVSIVGLQWDGVWGCLQVSALIGMQCSYCIFLGE